MNRYVTVSAKIRRELKEEAERLGIDFSEVIRRAIEEEVKRRKLQLLREKLNGLRGALEKIDVEEIVELIRRDREER